MSRNMFNLEWMRRGWVVAIGSLVVVVVLSLILMHDDSDRPHATDRPLVMYCAAGIIKPVEEAAKQYEKEYGQRIQIEPSGSGKLLSTIRVTPGKGHLYLAADRWYIDKARRLGLVAEDIPVAAIRPVIVVAKGNPKNIKGVDDLLRDDVKVALANPELASIGRTVERLFEQRGLWPKLKARSQKGTAVTFVGTVNEVAQAIRIGAADAGIVWDSLAKQFGLHAVDSEVLNVAVQTITVGVLEPNDRPTASLQFARYLAAKDRGEILFAKHHFTPLADADVWAEHPEILFMAGAMLKPGIDKVIQRFEQREGVTINRVYNGCGVLVSQMKAGSNPEAYFSCDVSYLTQVQDRFELGDTVSRNFIVMAVPKGNPKKIKLLKDLTRGGLKIGMAHPVNSALGALADRMLKKHKLHSDIYKANRVIHTDAGHMLVNQLRTGALDVIIVYRSNVLSNPENAAKHMDIIGIDLPDAQAIQPFTVAKEAKHPYLMRRLFKQIITEQNEQRFKDLGFEWIYRKKK